MNKHGVDPGPPLRHQPLTDSQSPLVFYFQDAHDLSIGQVTSIFM